MAHYALVNSDGIVVIVPVIKDEWEADGEVAACARCSEFFNNIDALTYAGDWKKASYWTRGGVHEQGGTPFRKNFPSPGYTYDSARDAFIPPKRWPSWTLDESTCLWVPPVAYPDDGKNYNWNEAQQQWDLAS